MSARRYSTAALLGLAGLARGLEAQRVSGTVREAGTGAPVAAAVVWLATAGDSSLRRMLTDANGRYSLPRGTNAVRVHVVRLGFTPRALPLTTDTLFDVELERIPARLSSMNAQGQQLCPDDGSGGRGFLLWEQARAALLANVVGRETQAPRLRLLAFERTLSEDGRVKQRSHTSREVTGDRSYVAGRSPAAFAVYGYLDDTPSQRVLYAPDEETLLAPSFLEHHCLRVRGADESHPNQVGISFEPTLQSRDTLVDVRGVLWIDAEHPALRSLTYSYVGLEPAARSSGGEITFATMNNGMQIVSHWVIRVAVISVERSRANDVRKEPPRDLRSEARLLGIHEVGGDVGSARFPDGTVWESNTPRIVGTLVDPEDRPVVNGVVWVVGGSDTVTTDSAGHFELPPMSSGIHTLLASDSVLALAGVPRTAPASIFLGPDAGTVVRMSVVPRPEVLARTCAGQRYAAGDGVMLGQVIGANGAAVSGARIELWRRYLSKNVEYFREEISGAAGDDGRFIICGAPVSQVMRLRATKGDVSVDTIIREHTADVIYVPLTLREP